MSNLPASLESLESRPCLLQSVEVATRTSRYGDTVYILRNSSASSYLELDAVDYEVARWMDGTATLVDLASEFFLKHRQLAMQRIQRLVRALNDAGLLVGRENLSSKQAGKSPELDLLPLVTLASALFQRLGRGPSFYLTIGLVLIGGVALLRGLLFASGPAMVIHGSLTLGMALVLLLLPLVALVHELAHGVATVAAGRKVGRAGVDMGEGGLSFYIDTSDILMAPRRALLSVALAGPCAGLAIGGVFAILSWFSSDSSATGFALWAYLCFVLNLLNLLPIGQFDGYRALVWLLESPRPLRQAWLELQAGLHGDLPKNLMVQSISALLGTAAVVIGFGFLLIWGMASSLRWLALEGGDTNLADALFPGSMVAGLAILTTRTCWRRYRRWQRERRRYTQDAITKASQLLSDVPLFAGLGEEERSRLLKVVRVEHAATSKVVIHQGAQADRFYVIVVGEAEVRLQRRNGSSELLARLGPGDYFGEIALLTGGLRTASVIARTDLTLLSLSRRQFREVIAPRLEAQVAAARAIEGRAVLARFSIFDQLTSRELDHLLAHLTPVSVSAGEAVIRQGDVGDRFYLLLSGSAVVIRTEESDTKELRRLGSGDYFGEVALFHDVPRTATVVAETPLELLALERADFHSLLGEYRGLGQTLEKQASARLGSNQTPS